MMIVGGKRSNSSRAIATVFIFTLAIGQADRISNFLSPEHFTSLLHAQNAVTTSENTIVGDTSTSMKTLTFGIERLV